MDSDDRGVTAPDGGADDNVEERASRFELLMEAYEGLCVDFPKLKKHFRIDPAILHDTVSCYFDDVWVTKRRNEITNADCHKRAAFTLKWIARLKPIQIISNDPNLPETVYVINELFAVKAAFGFLERGPDNRKNTKALFRSLVLIARKRELDAEVLATLMFALEAAA